MSYFILPLIRHIMRIYWVIIIIHYHINCCRRYICCHLTIILTSGLRVQWWSIHKHNCEEDYHRTYPYYDVNTKSLQFSSQHHDWWRRRISPQRQQQELRFSSAASRRGKSKQHVNTSLVTCCSSWHVWHRCRIVAWLIILQRSTWSNKNWLKWQLLTQPGSTTLCRVLKLGILNFAINQMLGSESLILIY